MPKKSLCSTNSPKTQNRRARSATLGPAAAEQLQSDLHYLKLTHLADHWAAMAAACHQKQLSFAQSLL